MTVCVCSELGGRPQSLDEYGSFYGRLVEVREQREELDGHAATMQVRLVVGLSPLLARVAVLHPLCGCMLKHVLMRSSVCVWLCSALLHA